ncbi:MAG: HAD-IIIC family phosphatase [Kibdelosporangium sp.]
MTRTPLHELRDGPGLAAAWPSLPAVLNEMAARGDLITAGALLERVTPEEILATGARPELVDVTITGHGTLAELNGPLIAEFARHGLLARIRPTDFNSHQRVLTQPAQADLTLCVLDPYMIYERLPKPWRAEDVERELAEAAQEWTALADNYDGTLVLNTIPLLPLLSRQLVDHRSRARLGIAWRRFNSALLELAERPHVITIDLDPLIAAGGPATEPRKAGYVRTYFEPHLLAAYAREVGHLAKALRGRAKKVLALDLDGTMWDGVLAEDGMDGVSMAGTSRGDAFARFQQVVGQLAAQGVLLVISSKNDHDEVLATLAGHPDMLVRPSDFTAIEATWDTKPAALVRMAGRIGLDLSGFVLVDDSATERRAVSALLPSVAVIPVDDEPALHVDRLLADGWFDMLELTGDDTARAAHYHREEQREAVRTKAISDEDYLRELAVRVGTAPIRPHEVARVAQLTQRTNQFNLTTQRLQPADVPVGDPDRLVLTIRSADRFGDDGLVGAIFTRIESGEMHIANMVLSCRVFGRRIEHTAMAALLIEAKTRGVTVVHGYYQPTERNRRFEDFYPAAGFVVSASPDSGPARYSRELG